jgi:DNA-binding transcriptional MerR regulator
MPAGRPRRTRAGDLTGDSSAGRLLPEPERPPAGYRQYTQAEVGRLNFIRTAQRLGVRLDEIREILAFRDHGQPPCEPATRAAVAL